jgi:hypothetical protein
MVSHGKGAWSPDRYNFMIAARVALMMAALGHAKVVPLARIVGVDTFQHLV